MNLDYVQSSTTLLVSLAAISPKLLKSHHGFQNVCEAGIKYIEKSFERLFIRTRRAIKDYCTHDCKIQAVLSYQTGLSLAQQLS